MMSDAQQIAEHLESVLRSKFLLDKFNEPGEFERALLDAGLREAVEALWKAEAATAKATFLDDAGDDLTEANDAIRSVLAALKGEKT